VTDVLPSLSPKITPQAVFDAMTEAMSLHQIICNADGKPVDYRFLLVNPAFEAITGLNRADVLGKRVRQVIPDIEESFIEAYGRVALTGKPIRFNAYAASMKKHFSISAFCPQRGFFATIFYDLTAQNQMAMEAARLAAAINPGGQARASSGETGALNADQLTKELQKSQALFEISQMLAGTVDLRKTLQQIADAANRLTKSSTRAILHLLDADRLCLEPVAISGDVPPGTMMSLNFRPGEGVAGKVVATGEAINVADVTIDPRYVASQRPRQVTGVLGPIDLPALRALLVAPVMTGGTILGTLSVQSPAPGAFNEDDSRLLTALGAQAALAIEKARLYDDLQTALQHEKSTRAQLVQAEKLAALGRIVASVAHELNNPLQAIQNALYLIQMEANLSEQGNQDLKTVLNETERMAGLIARLRETYRPATTEAYQPTSLNVLVNDVQHLLATHLRHSSITLTFKPDEALPLIPVIRDQIKQVILNICLNAVEAMKDGGHTDIITEYHPLARNVVLRIADNGPAIDPQILPLIFDPFVTTKAGEGGTGLGLAITYDIIQRHMGRVEVDSIPGRGTTFNVILPMDAHLPDPLAHPDRSWGGK